MICMFCLRRLSVAARRCGWCLDYLATLRLSESQEDREYGAHLVDLAHRRYTERERGMRMAA